MAMSRHGRLAREYWETYRPQAFTELGTPQQQEDFFRALDLRIGDRISELTQQMLQRLPVEERATARMATQQQATETVYNEEIYLPKEAGTEQREM